MQFTLSKAFLYWSSVVVLGIVIGLSMQFVQAWTAPSATPPTASTISGPLTVSSVGQTKAGNLALNSSGAYLNALLIPNGRVGVGTINPTQLLDVNGYVRGATGLCIGNDCRAAWPQGGVSGSGTNKYLAMWTGTETLGNSAAGGIYFNGSDNLVINTLTNIPYVAETRRISSPNNQNFCIWVPGGDNWYACLQTDGNFVIQKNATVCWSTKTGNTGSCPGY